MSFQHVQLANGKWASMAFCEQMANVGSEIGRAVAWRSGDADTSRAAFYRALELLDLTIQNTRGFCRLRELTRIRELLADHFAFNNEYATTDEYWDAFFGSFAWAAAVQRRRK